MGLQYYDFTLATNGIRDLPCEGTYFRYYSGSAGGADESILIKGDTQGVSSILRPGQSILVPETIKTWKISNYKGAGTISGIVIIGDGEIQDSQVAGVVSIVDGGKARTGAGSAFCVAAFQTAVAAQMPVCQVWNPAGSGKNVYIESLMASSSVAQIVRAGWNTANFTLQGSQGSKRAGNAGGAAQPAIGTSATIPTGFVYNLQFQLIASQSQVINFREPIMLPPGYGFCVQGATVNTDLSANFEYWEE